MPLQCRTCAGTIYNTNAKNLFYPHNGEILNNIFLVTGMALFKDPTLPSCICAGCLIDLNRAIIFRDQCINTQEQFKNSRSQNISADCQVEFEDDKYVQDIKFEIENEAVTIPITDLDESSIENKSFLILKENNDRSVKREALVDNQTTDDETNSLIASLRKEICSIFEHSSEEDLPTEEFLESSDDSTKNNSNNSPNTSSSANRDINSRAKPLGAAIPLKTRSQRQRTIKQINARDELSDQYSESTSTSPATIKQICHSRISQKDKKKYVTWKHLTEDEVIARKRQMRRKDCVCDQCGRHFTDQSNFKLHMLRHTGIKNYSCEECSRKFYTEHLLSLHKRIVHNGEKPYACKYCSKPFHNSTTRAIHERTHTKIRPYVCKHCSKTFSSASGRKRHELIHTGVRPFQCLTCNQTFQRNTHLKAHYRSKLHIQKEMLYHPINDAFE